MFYNWISIREYRASDLNDLVNANYPIENVPELTNPYKTLKSKIFDALKMSETRRLVLYHKKHKKCIGIVTLRKVNKNLWGIWDIYVAPSYLKQRCVKKTFGSVDINNIPSRKTIERIWDSYLPQKYYRFNASVPLLIRKVPQSQITVRDANPKDKKSLFQIYCQCVSKKWKEFLEINESNFRLPKNPGPPFPEGMLRLISPKRVLIAENLNGQIVGYAVTKYNITPIIVYPASLYLFLSPNLSSDNATAVLSGFVRFLHRKGYTKFEMFSININEKLLDEISLTLEKCGIKISKFLVCTKL
jgi:hypothetical protein